MRQIENNVPMPDRQNGPTSRFPFKAMEVGQSILIPHAEIETMYGPETIRGMAGNAGRRYGMKFSTRKQKDGIRIWRVA